MKGLKPEAYYWGTVIMIFKIILLSTLILMPSIRMAALTGYVIMMGYYALFQRVQPYDKKDVNRTEKHSIIVYIILTFIMAYSTDLDSTNLETGLVILTAVIIFVFMLILFWKFWEKFRMYIRIKRNKYSETHFQRDFDSMMSEDDDEISSSQSKNLSMVEQQTGSYQKFTEPDSKKVEDSAVERKISVKKKGQQNEILLN